MPTERRHSLEIFFRRRDNAEHFHGKNFELACAQIGNRVEYAPTPIPRYKASIERWFWKQNRRLLHELPGTTFSNVLDRDDYAPQKHAVISIDACLELFHLWIVDIYHQTVHRGIRNIPHRRWVENILERPSDYGLRSVSVLQGRTLFCRKELYFSTTKANDRIDDLSEPRFELLPTEHEFRMAGDCIDNEERLAEIGLRKTSRF